MKLGIVRQRYTPFGGAERFVERAIDALLGRGVRIRVYTRAWLQALELFTLPSWGEEGVPQAILQAMACGLPVVSTTVGAITEAVTDGVTGLIVPPRDVPALGGALARLRDDAALRARLGAAGRDRAVADFGIERMLASMEAVFRSVIDQAR